jgi:hypothetical protein
MFMLNYCESLATVRDTDHEFLSPSSLELVHLVNLCVDTSSAPTSTLQG